MIFVLLKYMYSFIWKTSDTDSMVDNEEWPRSGEEGGLFKLVW